MSSAIVGATWMAELLINGNIYHIQRNNVMATSIFVSSSGSAPVPAHYVWNRTVLPAPSRSKMAARAGKIAARFQAQQPAFFTKVTGDYAVYSVGPSEGIDTLVATICDFNTLPACPISGHVSC